ncbi:hypothetical protein CVT91_02240 [Candidatus Atribacteria bacterium HGW-Atribacteria-1]|nr:MAG: hypothetical protein CVT91_02240 [Candidatus Atribacteria bacterium HGW-Atribacteria-1]
MGITKLGAKFNLTIFLIVGLLIGITTIYMDQAGILFILVFMLVLCCFLVVMKYKNDIFRTLFFSSIMHAFFFGLGSIFYFYRPHLLTRPELKDYLIWVVLIAIIGYLFLVLGYNSKLYRIVHFPKLGAQWNGKKVLLASMAIYIGFWVYRILLHYRLGLFFYGGTIEELTVTQGGLERFMFSFFGLFFGQGSRGIVFILLFILFFQYFLAKKSNNVSLARLSKIIFLIVLIIEIFISIIRGWRGFLIGSFITVMFVINYASGKKFSLKKATIILLLILLFGVTIYSWSSVYRGRLMQLRIEKNDISIAELVDLIRISTERFGELVFDQKIRNFYIDNIVVRFDRVNNLAVIVADTPEQHDYIYGKTLIFPALFYIPRLIWTEKPIVSELIPENWFARRYGIVPSNAYNTFMSLPLVAEFYMNLGLVMVIIGMFAVGVIYRMIYEFAKTNKFSPSSMLIYFIMWYEWIYLGSFLGLGSLVLDSMIRIITFVPFLWFVQRRQLGKG